MGLATNVTLGSMKMTYHFKGFDMSFSNLTTQELITQANDPRLMAQLDQGDLRSMVQELSDRLEQHFYMSMAEIQNRKYE